MAVDQPKPSDALEETSDGDLLIYSALADEDPVLGRRAFQELHRRYSSRLYASCRTLCRQFGLRGETAEDLVSATFAKAIERASTYQSDSTASPERQRTRTLGWLYTIAERLLFDWHRNPHRPGPLNQTTDDRHVEDYGGEDFAFLMADEFDARDSSAKLRLIAQAFDSILNAREQHVLLATVMYRTYSPAGTHMQRGKAHEVATSLGTTAPNLRKLRQRAIAKIDCFLNDNHRRSEPDAK